jgi:RNA polymerase sigma-70 factor (ECF subfamily)
MSDESRDWNRWLPDARAGSPEALGQALDACRAYLQAVAERELDADLRAKGGASDVVQETFLEAFRDFGGFHGESEDELLAWLRRMLLNNLANFRRRYRDTDKRAAGREVPVDACGSAGDWRESLAADSPTPSVQLMQQERDLALEQALARLPPDQRDVIQFRYRDELPFEEIARRMNRTSAAARQLWSRAIERLEKELES